MRTTHIPGAEARFGGWLNVRAEARTYLRSKRKTSKKQRQKPQQIPFGNDNEKSKGNRRSPRLRQNIRE